MHPPPGSGSALAAIGVASAGLLADAASGLLAAASEPGGGLDLATGVTAVGQLGAVGALVFMAQRLLDGRLVARDTATAQANTEQLVREAAAREEKLEELLREAAAREASASDRERKLLEALLDRRPEGPRP